MTNTTSSDAVSVEVADLTKIYNSRRHRQVVAVDSLSLRFEGGRISGLLGPNGAGKTTLIKMICGLVWPTRGRILVNGQDLLRRPSQTYRQIGVVLEGNRNIYWRLSVKENLEYFGTMRGLTGKQLRARIGEILEFIDLEAERNTLGQDLSRGMQQRVGIGLALLHDPQILLLDEPTLGLDVYSSQTLRARLRELASQGKVILISTHQMRDAQQLFDAVMIMNKGQCVAYDSVPNLLELFSTSLVSIEFEGSLNADQLTRLHTISPHVAVQDHTLQLLVESPPILYQAIDVLKQTMIPIVAIEERTDLEDVFVALTAADVAPLRLGPPGLPAARHNLVRPPLPVSDREYTTARE